MNSVARSELALAHHPDDLARLRRGATSLALTLGMCVLGLAAGASPPETPAASGGHPAREAHPRAAELQEFSAKLFPQRTKPSRTAEDVRALRAELRSLAAALQSVERDSSPPQLQALRERDRAARAAFQALRAELDRTGRGALRADLDGKFQPLWEDVRQALERPDQREVRLAAALARIDAALARRSEGRGLGRTTLHLGSPE